MMRKMLMRIRSRRMTAVDAGFDMDDDDCDDADEDDDHDDRLMISI